MKPFDWEKYDPADIEEVDMEVNVDPDARTEGVTLRLPIVLMDRIRVVAAERNVSTHKLMISAIKLFYGDL